MKRVLFLCMTLPVVAACAGSNQSPAESNAVGAQPTSYPSSFIVFFASGAADLTPEARIIVDQAAAAARQNNPRMVAVSTGALSSDNLALAQPRFAAIRDALIADGVPVDIIARANIAGEEDAASPLADQRAEIRLFPGQ